MSGIEKLFRITLIVFCGAWLLWKPLAGPLLIFLLLFSVIGLFRKNNQFRLRKNQLFWLVLFILYGCSLFWSSQPDFPALERKLAFLVFPILVGFKWQKPLPLAQMWLSHIIACIVLVFIAYYDAIMCQMTLGNSVRCFSTTYFSQVHHPSYFSAFLIFSIIGLMLRRVAWFLSKPRWLSWLLIAIFTAMHLHLGSLAGIMSLALVFMTYISWQFSKKIGWTKSLVVGCSTLFVGVLLALQSQEIKADAQNAWHFTKSYLSNPTKFIKGRTEPLQGNEVRLLLWTASYQIGVAHPFGLGLGGLEPKLTQKLEQWGYPEQAKKEFNPHNQYLQIWNELGWIGLLLFLATILSFGLFFYREQNLSALLVLGTFIVFCLFESMLQRESGIVFFICWLLVLLAQPIKKPS
jgi:O-antigen ligase